MPSFRLNHSGSAKAESPYRGAEENQYPVMIILQRYQRQGVHDESIRLDGKLRGTGRCKVYLRYTGRTYIHYITQSLTC